MRQKLLILHNQQTVFGTSHSFQYQDLKNGLVLVLVELIQLMLQLLLLRHLTHQKLHQLELRVRLYLQMKIILQLYLFLELTSHYRTIQALLQVVSRVLSLVMQKTLVVLYFTLTIQLVEQIHMILKKVRRLKLVDYLHPIQTYQY